MARLTGRYERTVAGGEEVYAFVPQPIHGANPPLIFFGDTLGEPLEAAERALSRLDLAGEMVPSLDWFIYAFVRKEAVVTSQIEGTQATLVDLLAFEAEQEAVPDADIEEVCNYIEALRYARAELAKENGLPLSMRLLNEAHRRLLRGARGATRQPGEIRSSQNWIGGTRPGNAVYVPPPASLLPELLGDLEKYLHAEGGLPKLLRIGLAHVQFESIHPYLDGNGRIGRLLIALLLEHWGLLRSPLLYLSLFFKRHREEYYRRLNAVRTEGDWRGWLGFFLDGVAKIANEAAAAARELFMIVTADRDRLLASDRISVSALRLFEQLPKHPIVNVTTAMALSGTSKPTATRAIGTLVAERVLFETTGRKRDRSFAYRSYVERLRAGTELEVR
jgi:Fic family protein